MRKYSKDTEERKAGTAGRQLVFSLLDADHWDFKEETGNDVGRDCYIELSEDDEWRNHKIEGQIKGTKNIRIMKTCNCITFPLETKTINYALSSPVGFVLFVADITNKRVYYQCIQEYVDQTTGLEEKLDSEQKTINIHIPFINCLNEADVELQRYAKQFYRPK